MNNAYPETPTPENEPTLSYAPGSEERRSVQKRLRELREQTIEIPAFIGGEPVYPEPTSEVVPPHDHQHLLGRVHQSGADEVEDAIDAALDAKAEWAAMDFPDRAAIFLRAAD
ncbi:MAG: 1-pyrroline-5-carboxylate dehydrogenase, partial [Bacteroidetes bacterium QH_6_64_77]